MGYKRFYPKSTHKRLLNSVPNKYYDEITMKEWVKEFAGLVFQRSFLLTALGLMGLGPDTIQEGDMICILLGCQVPVILRPNGEHYIFLGGAYIDGYMHGRAIDDLKDGVLLEQTFELH